jgi:hypothetical protein
MTVYKFYKFKDFVKNYSKRKIKDELIESILQEVVAEYESVLITLEMLKRKLK